MALPSVKVSVEGETAGGREGSSNDSKKKVIIDDGEEENDQLLDLPSSSSTTTSKQLSQMTSAERREHSRKHSRIHSRNLSVFFPQPGSEAEKEADQLQAENTFLRKPEIYQLDTNVSSLGDQGDLSTASSLSASPSKSRKGHHRKHSVMHASDFSNSHNEQHQHHHDHHHHHDNNNRNATTAHAYPNQQHHQRQHSSSSNSFVGSLLSTPFWKILSNTALPPAHRPILFFGTFHFILGAVLWMKGQSGDSLAMTGLGYLIVFDAFGILNTVASEWLTEQWRREKASSKSNRKFVKPYGPHRIETLLQFSQTIYLLFAAIYVCKESVEHALLEGHEEEHHEQDEIGLHFPRGVLVLTTLACIFSNVVLQNHVKLVAACGFSTAASEASTTQRRRAGHGRQTSVLADPTVMAGPFLQLFANPFSVTILFFSCTLTISAFAMPAFQAIALDKVLAGLESVSMLYIAYPASKALGKVLLQTAPKEHEVQSVQLMRTLRTIEEHRLVTYIAPPHLWQLTPPTSAINHTPSTVNFASHGLSSSSSSSSLLLGQATNRTAKNASLIASVQIFLHDDSSDADILDITRWAWQLLAPAVGAGAGLPVGESLRGALRAGEVVVQVCREKERLKYRETQKVHEHGHDHHHHHHEHEHGHDLHHHHEHEHDHQHKQDCNHSHNHNHTHEHSHTSHTHHSHDLHKHHHH